MINLLDDGYITVKKDVVRRLHGFLKIIFTRVDVYYKQKTG